MVLQANVSKELKEYLECLEKAQCLKTQFIPDLDDAAYFEKSLADTLLKMKQSLEEQSKQVIKRRLDKFKLLKQELPTIVKIEEIYRASCETID